MSSPVGWLKSLFGAAAADGSAHIPCFWQTDVHSHLIPGIDDGVETLQQAITCIRQLADWGIQRIITTPHVNHAFYPNTTATIRAGLAVVQQQVALEQIPVQLDAAAEYMLDEFFMEQLDQHDLLTLGANRYLLVETGLAGRSLNLDDMLFQIQAKGYTPILAHPERYHYFHNDLGGLERLRDQGCLFQLNWMSLTGRYGSGPQQQAKVLLKHKWVDFIGSDMHRPADFPKLQALFSLATYELLRQQPLRNGEL